MPTSITSTGRARVALPALFFAFTALFLGCGGGGGGGDELVPFEIDLGELSSTEQSRSGRTFLNPLGGLAEVTPTPVSGPIFFDPGAFPVTVAGRSGVTLSIVFEPTGPGAVSELVGLRFRSGNQSVIRYYEVTATGEAIPWTLEPSLVDFGDVFPGDSSSVVLEFTNGSARSPVTLTGASIPTAFALDPYPFPITVDPGETGQITVVHTPPTPGTYGGLLRLGAGDPGGPVDFTVGSQPTGSGEKVIDLGTQTLVNGETPELSVEVPDSAISVSIEGRMSPNAEIGLRSFSGPDGRVYENETSTGPLVWVESRDVFFTHVPSSDRSATQLVPGGGTYKFKLYRHSGSGTTMDVRVHLELRAGTSGTTAVLPLNIFFAPGLTPDAATAEADQNLQSMLTQVGQILGAQNISLGDIDYYDLSDQAFNQISQGEEDQLFAQSAVASKTRMNLFLVSQVWGGSLLGLAGSIDGAKEKGSSVTGVVSFYYDAQPGAVAAVVAHEMCHYLGLFHTVESTGTHDVIDDTPDCPVSGTSGTCPEEGGDMLMHWQLTGGKDLTNGQGLVLRGHPLLHHPTGGANALRVKPAPWRPDAATIQFLRSAPPGWCGTRR